MESPRLFDRLSHVEGTRQLSREFLSPGWHLMLSVCSLGIDSGKLGLLLARGGLKALVCKLIDAGLVGRLIHELGSRRLSADDLVLCLSVSCQHFRGLARLQTRDGVSLRLVRKKRCFDLTLAGDSATMNSSAYSWFLLSEFLSDDLRWIRL